MSFKNTIETFLVISLLFCMTLFVLQPLANIKKKSIDKILFCTLVGFLVIQIFSATQGYLHKDYLLIGGNILNLFAVGVLVFLILRYKNNSNKLEEIFSQLPGYVYWKDKNGVFLGWNTEAAKKFGLVKTDIGAKTEYQLLQMNEAAKIWQSDFELMQKCQEKVLEEERTINQDTNFFLSHKKPLKDNAGNVIGMLCTAVDITEYKMKYIEQSEILENIISLMPGHVYWINRDGYYLGCNNNQAKSAGLTSRKDIIGKKNKDLPWNLNAEEICDNLDNINEKVMATGREVIVEEQASTLTKNGAIFLSTKVPLFNKMKNVIGMLGISIDITDIKKNEEELRRAKEISELASKLKDDFILNMEHDIRTPLSAINMISAQMTENETDTYKREKLADIATCSKEIMDYCYNTIEYLKARFSSEPIIEKKFDLNKLIDRIVGIEKPVYENKKLAFSLKIDNNVPNILIGDDFRLERILINLVNNAIKFTHKGFVSLEVKFVRFITNREIVIQFIIEDSGIGIHESKLNIIYEKFARVFSSNKGLYKGQGLGLTIVKKFTDDMEGEIELQSTLNVGTKVICTYPFKVTIS